LRQQTTLSIGQNFRLPILSPCPLCLDSKSAAAECLFMAPGGRASVFRRSNGALQSSPGQSEPASAALGIGVQIRPALQGRPKPEFRNSNRQADARSWSRLPVSISDFGLHRGFGRAGGSIASSRPALP
jgi:hypothetical protein